VNCAKSVAWRSRKYDMSTISTDNPTIIYKVLHRFMHMDMRRVRLLLFCTAVVIYGAFGSPTPDHPGLLEAVIAALLVVSIWVSGAWQALRFDKDGPLWKSAGQVLLLFALSVPLVAGVYEGHDTKLLVRDALAFVFMMLPLFALVLFRCAQDVKILSGAVLALGVLFALRSGPAAVPFLGDNEALYYLANMPSVLFAALFFSGMALNVFIEEFKLRSFLKVAVLIVFVLVCLAPILEAQQRASMGVFVLSLAVLGAFYLWKFPRRTLIFFVFVFCVSIPFWGEFVEAFGALSRKTALVGSNMRFEEWRAVWDAISVHPFSLMTGLGWGATFASPAVADIEVNFTHGLLSSFIFCIILSNPQR